MQWVAAVWAALAVVVLAHSLLHATLGSSENLLLILLLAHAIFTGLMGPVFLRGLWAGIAAVALLARAIVLGLETWSQIDLPFLGGEADAAGFYRAAVAISQDLSLFGETYGGTYTALAGALFHMTGQYALLAQYINVVLGTSTVVICMLIVANITSSAKAPAVAGTLVAVMPSSVIYSAAFLREAVVQFLVAISILFFVHWLRNGKARNVVLAVSSVIIASLFHAGVVGILVGYTAAIFLSAKDSTTRVRTLATGMLIIIAGVAAIVRSPDLFLGKFQSVQDEEDLLQGQNYRAGGAAYLTEVQVDNWVDFILFAPIRAVYFVASPLPLDWRGIGDAIAFTLDSSWYLAVVVIVWRKRSALRGHKMMAPLLIVLVSVVLIFGVGVSNAGTALRHRTKLVPVFVAVAAAAWSSRPWDDGKRASDNRRHASMRSGEPKGR